MTQQVGKYQLIRKLATGGMAEVFLAKAAGPMGFEKTLVLKRILPHLAEEPAFVEMFLSEAKLAAQLTHSNIVQIFDFGEADGAYFLAMEYIDGPNLRVLVKRASAQGIPLPPTLCARLIADACDGLAFAHDFVDPDSGEPLGLIHRDISPDNILLSRQGAVKVVDFGIAKAAGQSHRTQSGVIKGKLAYMPPEQVRARPLDRRVDVYALGVVLYELLTAHKPFAVDTDVGLMQAILFEPLVPAIQHRPDLPEALLRILDKALAKECEQRYPDCMAFQSDLEDFILSVGKPVKTQHIAQFIAQVSSSTDSLQPTPQSGTPRGGPKHTVTPVHTPPPARTRTGANSVSETGTLKTPRPQATRPAVEAPEDVSELKTSPYIPPEETRPEVARSSTESPRRSNKWVPLGVGCALLVIGGGVVLWRMGSGAEPQKPPVVAQRPLPTTTPPSPVEPATSAPAGSVTDNPRVQQAEAKAPSVTPPVAAPKATPPASVPAPRQEKPVAQASRPRPTPTPVVVKPPAKGTLELRVRPYATVFVDGKKLGDTPMSPTELPEGRYSVKFVNQDLPKTVTRTVDVKAGQSTVIKLNLSEE